MAKKKEKTNESDELAPVRSEWLTVLGAEIPAANVGNVRENARTMRVQLEDARKEAKKPHLDAGRDIDAKYKAVTDVLDQVIRMCDDRILAAKKTQEDTLKALVSDSTLPPAEKHVALTGVLQAQVVPGGVRLRIDYDYEIVDFDAIPREWLTIDDKRVRAHLKETAGTVQIPGLSIIRSQKVVAR
jgi:hypothetical protein